MSKPVLPPLAAPMLPVPAGTPRHGGTLSDAVLRAVALSRKRAGIRVLVVGYEPRDVTMPVGSSRRVGPPSFWVMPNTSAIIFDPLDNVTARMRVGYIPYSAVVWDPGENSLAALHSQPLYERQVHATDIGEREHEADLNRRRLLPAGQHDKDEANTTADKIQTGRQEGDEANQLLMPEPSLHKFSRSASQASYRACDTRH